MNSSSNSTINLQKQNVSETLRLVSLVICVVVITLGSLGNSLVLLFFCSKWFKLKSFEIFMTSLALSDFLKAVAAPLRIILTLTRFIGNYGCKLLVFLNTISTTASAITLLSVSIDRFIIVKWPLHQRPHRLNIIYIIAFIWLAAGCLGSVYLVKDHITYYSKYFMCSSNMKKQISVGLTIGIFTIQTLVPITLFTIMYFLIIFELKKTAKNKALLDSHRVIAIRLQQNSKTIKMVVFAVVIFYVCILPSNIYYLWYEFNQNALLIETASTIYDILILLEICSSIGNPVLYSRLLTTFRREIIKIVLFCCQKKSVNRRKSLSEIIRCSLLYNSALHLKDRSSTKTSNC